MTEKTGHSTGAAKLSNPFRGTRGHDCFGCSDRNPAGLHLEFAEEGDAVTCRWTPDPKFQGWDGVLHGGVVTTILDETSGWAVLRRFQRAAMTTRIEVRFLHPTPATDPVLVARARVSGRVNEKIVTVRATLENASGMVCATADADYYVMDEERSKAMGFTECVPEAAQDRP
ncbi:MAG: PaaI family thioesterase [Kiritimatiellae bacterium]|nr:PaaI family thioesterase [Kiritimatiellia bacterium]